MWWRNAVKLLSNYTRQLLLTNALAQKKQLATPCRWVLSFFSLGSAWNWLRAFSTSVSKCKNCWKQMPRAQVQGRCTSEATWQSLERGPALLPIQTQLELETLNTSFAFSTPWKAQKKHWLIPSIHLVCHCHQNKFWALLRLKKNCGQFTQSPQSEGLICNLYMRNKSLHVEYKRKGRDSGSNCSEPIQFVVTVKLGKPFLNWIPFSLIMHSQMCTHGHS